jgi:hypothetical protein
MVRDIFIFLFALGLILFNWPIISVFDTELSKYFFIAWFLFIAAIYLIAEHSGKGERRG